jgi:hypothetical protein
MSEMQEAVLTLKRQMIDQARARLTEPQSQMLDRIYPNGIPDDKLESAYDLCIRTIRKNEAGR